MPPPPGSQYVELHCHSAYSFLDGASQPEELVAAAITRGHAALALTDHDSLSGSMEFAQAARSLGLRAIHGAEVTLDDGRHLTLLVRDATGWRNLCRLLTRAHAHTRDGPQRDRSEPAVSLDDVEAHHAGSSASAAARAAACATSRRCAGCSAASATTPCASSCSARSPATTGRSIAV